MNSGTPPLSDDDSRALANAKQGLEQIELLWNDQVRFADELRDKRRTYTAVLVLLGGLGVFRISPFRDPVAVPVLSPELNRVVAVIVGLALSLFLIGAYLLYTDRSKIRVSFVNSIEHSASRRQFRRWMILWTGLTPDQFRAKSRGHRFRTVGGRASDLAKISPDDLRGDFLNAPMQDAVIHRAVLLQVAYEKLAKANNRVNRRIEASVILFGAGYLGLGVVFGLYVWNT